MIYGGELRTLKANWLKRNMSWLPPREKRKWQQPERLPLWKLSSRCGKPILSGELRVV